MRKEVAEAADSLPELPRAEFKTCQLKWQVRSAADASAGRDAGRFPPPPHPPSLLQPNANPSLFNCLRGTGNKNTNGLDL